MAENSSTNCQICNSPLTANGLCTTCHSDKSTAELKKLDILAAEKEKSELTERTLADFQVLDSTRQDKLPSKAVLYNATTGERFELTSTINKVGRDRKNNISISADHYISRHHAWILFIQDGFWVEDLNSANGTLLNGEVVNERKQIFSGDKLTFGTTELIFAC